MFIVLYALLVKYSGASIPIYRWRQCAMGNFGGEFIFTKGFAKL